MIVYVVYLYNVSEHNLTGGVSDKMLKQIIYYYSCLIIKTLTLVIVISVMLL